MALGEIGHWFNQANVNAGAPATGGVYGIYVPGGGGYVYIGQSGDIRTRLIQHLGDATHPMHRYQGLAFTCELVAGDEQARCAREAALIALWNPACNR
jgi:hypothetical protein